MNKKISKTKSKIGKILFSFLKTTSSPANKKTKNINQIKPVKNLSALIILTPFLK